ATVPAGRIARGFNPETGGTAAAGDLLVPFLVALIVGLLATMVFTAAAVARIDAVAHNREMTFGEAVSYGLRRALPFFAASMLYVIAVSVGLVLVIVPGVIVGVYLAFGAVATVVNGKGPIEGLKYSWDLVRGHWWRTLFLGLVTGLIRSE